MGDPVAGYVLDLGYGFPPAMIVPQDGQANLLVAGAGTCPLHG